MFPIVDDGCPAPLLHPHREGSAQVPPPNKVPRCKMSVLRCWVQVPGARGRSRRQRGRRPYPTLSTAAGGWRTAPPKPSPGRAARSTTSILRLTTRVQRARCCIRWHLRSPVADAERPVPILTPLQRGSPKSPLLGEASESTVCPFVLRQRYLTACRPYPGSLPMGLIALMRRLPLNGFNFHGIDAFLMPLTICYPSAGGGASCS